MEAQLKQRIVGGIVIICVLAIFLPILLHKPKTQSSAPVSLPIATPATVSQMSLQLPQQTTATASTQSAQVANSTPQEKLAVAEQAVVTPVHTSAAHVKHVAKRVARPVPQHINTKILQSAVSTPQAWVVQLGSFSEQRHATALVARLRAKGFEAYTRTSHESHGTITRVFVGPEINKAQMQRINTRLDKTFHLSGVVRKYTV